MKIRSLFLLPILLSVLLSAAPQLLGQASPTQAPPPASTPAKKIWLIRLIPPRPTFDKDMTDAEGQLMEQHFIYWKAFSEKGVCLFGGPVFDPKGVYGLIVVATVTEDEARELAAADPSVKGGLNHVEISEMKVAFWPKAK